MVQRDLPISVRIGKSSGRDRAHDPPGKGQGVVVATMEFDAGVQRCEGVLRGHTKC